ncbi:MAG: MBL fold metallo-hydrolase [Luteolibacter sp.]
MKVSKFTGGLVQTNGYLVESAGGNFLVDAPAGIAKWVKDKGVRVDAVYLTHQHYDHVEDVAALGKAGAKVFGWAEYSKRLTLESSGASWGVPSVIYYEVDNLIPVGEGEVCGMTFKAAHVPGHSLDSLTFYFPDGGLVFAGDALFAGSVGRCDLPGGSFELLLEGIKRELLTLPDETRVLPGHGRETTIGEEKKGNGYLK